MTRRHDPGQWGQFPAPREPQGLGWALVRQRTPMVLSAWLASPPAIVWATTSAEWALAWFLTATTALAMPEVRAAAVAQVRRVVVERRLRTAFREIPICSRSGTVPTVVRSVAARRGTVTWVWCPAGVTVDDLARERPALAAACFVDDVTVETHPRWPHVGIVHVLRTDLGHRVGR